MHYINMQHLAHVSIGSVLDVIQELKWALLRAKHQKGGGQTIGI